jgi:hypothetical protein
LWETMKFEGVGRVTVHDFALEVSGEIDDGDCRKGAFLGADAASDAEALGDEGKSRVWGDFNTSEQSASGIL